MIRLHRGAKAAIAAALTASLIVQSPQLVHATSSAQSKKSEAEKNLNDVNNKIEGLEDETKELQNEIDSTNDELVSLLVDVGILENEIEQNEKQLEKVTGDLKKAQKNEKKQYSSMKKRIKFMYERGDTAVLSSILESRSMADLLNRVEYVNEVYDYDRNLLNEYEETRKKVENLKGQVEDEKKELEATQDNLKQQQARLETTMANLRSQQANAETQIANAKELAKQYQQTISEQNQIIQAAAEQAAKTPSGGSGGSGGTPSGGSTPPPGNLNPPKTTNISGSDVVNYAMQFVGNPYVWGGKDPNTGADCSGFTSYVYAHFGISIPSYSETQRNYGQEVSYSNAQPGDLICYAGHVAIYMGNGQIVHAKGKAYGIVAGDNATYRTILSVRRLI